VPFVWSDQYGVRIQRVGEITGVEPSDDLTYRRHGRLKAVVLMTDGVFNTAWRNDSSPAS